MSYILEVTDFARIRRLAEAFHRRGFVRIEDRTFEIKGYCPGPGIVPDSATFHLDLRRGVQVAPEVIITNLAGLSLSYRYDKPREAPAAWRGPEDGLPPVGLVCEATHEDLNGGKPVKAEILKHHENGIGAAFFWIGAPKGSRNLLWAQHFMPIRTPEQIAAEERHDAVVAMRRISKYSQHIGIPDDLFEGLYDAGYRKFEIVDEQP